MNTYPTLSRNFSASGCRSPILSPGCESGDRVLAIFGVSLGRVAKIHLRSTIIGTIQTCLTWESLLENIESYSRDAGLPDHDGKSLESATAACLRTIVADDFPLFHSWNSEQYWLWRDRFYHSYLRHISSAPNNTHDVGARNIATLSSDDLFAKLEQCYGLGGLQRSRDVTGVISLYSSIFPEHCDCIDRAVVSEFKDTAYGKLDGRYLAQTNTGHLALVPQTCRLGDEICVFSGGATPFALRKQDGSEHHELLGQAYVHGAMHGEALLEIEGLEEQNPGVDSKQWLTVYKLV